MPSEDTKTKFNQYQKSDKAPVVIYADLECIIEKTNECKNNPKNSSTIKVNSSTISSLKSIANKHDVYRGRDFMKKFCENLRKHTRKIIKKKWSYWQKNFRNYMKMQKSVSYICNEKFESKYLKDKKYHKVRDCCHYTEEVRCAAHKKFVIIMIIKLLIIKFLWSKYEYHFTMKELVEKFKNI